jgi:predicted phage-related endonuclease
MPPLTQESNIIRARNVTASEVGALMGKHPYTTREDIFDRLSNPPLWESQRDPQSEAMALGTYMEPYIARYAATKLGLRLRANSRTREHPLHPLCATPDYLVLGHRMLVECKLSSVMYGWSEDTLAPHIEWQARAQLAVTDREVCIVAALVGSRFYSVQVVRDMEKERAMLREVDRIVNLVLSGGPRPEPMETKVSKVTIGAS